MELFICFFVCLLLVMYLLGITGVSVGVLGRINIIFGVIRFMYLFGCLCSINIEVNRFRLL